LSQIPGATEEVEQISKLLKGKIFLGNQATETNFKKYAENYDILHLAMHAVVDNVNPMYSKLVFTMTTGSGDDGLLNTYEIYNMHLKARLAVLSSCSSGEGVLKKGEGVISLSRGFAYAGCPSLIMTLWELEDNAGVELMVAFYKNLKKGYSKDVALQKAKLEFLRNKPQVLAHPFYWSAYQCVGDSSALYFRVYKYLQVILGIILMAIIFFIVVLYARSARSRPE